MKTTAMLTHGKLYMHINIYKGMCKCIMSKKRLYDAVQTLPNVKQNENGEESIAAGAMRHNHRCYSRVCLRLRRTLTWLVICHVGTYSNHLSSMSQVFWRTFLGAAVAKINEPSVVRASHPLIQAKQDLPPGPGPMNHQLVGTWIQLAEPNKPPVSSREMRTIPMVLLGEWLIKWQSPQPMIFQK